MKTEGSIEDRAWPAWVWSAQDRSIVAANAKARALWNLGPLASTSAFLFPARGKVTRKLHGAAIALLAGADQVQIDIKLPFAREETWQCKRIQTAALPQGALLLEAPQLGTQADEPAATITSASDSSPSPYWSDEAFNALALPVVMTAGDGWILHLNQEAERLAPSEVSDDLESAFDTGAQTAQLWTRPHHFRDFFSTDDDRNAALGAMAEAHRTGSGSFVAALAGVPGFPGGRTQIMIQRVGSGQGQAPLMMTFHKLAEAPSSQAQTGASLDDIHTELAATGTIAFELNTSRQIIYFSPAFATWLGKDAQDIGGRKPGELGITSASSEGFLQLSDDIPENERHMIRRPDGTISTVMITSIPMPSGTRDEARRLYLAKPVIGSADTRDKIEAPTSEPTTEPDEFLALFDNEQALTGASQDNESRDSNLVRLDDWREGDEIVLTADSFTALIASLDAALIGLDKDGNIKFINAPAVQLLGSTAPQLEGTPLANTFRATSAAKVKQFFEDPKAPGNDGFVSGCVLDPLGTSSKKDRVVLRLHALREKSPIRFCAYLRLNLAPSPALRDDSAGVSIPSRKRADFVAKMSHEIRTPLNAILGFSDLMLSEGMGPIGNEKYKEYMQDIHDSGNLILSLINDVLDLAKAEATGLTVDLKNFDLEGRIRQAVSILSGQARTSKVSLSIEMSDHLPTILADDRSVMQMLLNLVGNAIKFTPAGGSVLIKATPSGQDYVSLVIEDTGVGMTRSELERALTPFQQVSTGIQQRGDTRESGTGLGLPITRALAEANKAKFTIASTRNKGTRIEILFNQARAAAQ